MENTNRRKALLCWSAALFILAVPAIGLTAHRRKESREIFYYSDESMTEQVGYLFLPCTGGIVRSGRITKHAEVLDSSCPEPERPPPLPSICESELFECH